MAKALFELFKKYKEDNSPMSEEEKRTFFRMLTQTRDVIQLSEIDYTRLLEIFIPEGKYCYDDKGLCPYWYREDNEAVHCRYLDVYDYSECAEEIWDELSPEEIAQAEIILWDQCKVCGVKNA